MAQTDVNDRALQLILCPQIHRGQFNFRFSVNKIPNGDIPLLYASGGCTHSSPMKPAFLPLPDSLGNLQTLPGGSYGWHTHPFDELCLIDGSATTIGHAGKRHAASVGTLFLFKHGERHGYWNALRQSPRLWVLHYRGDPALYGAVPHLLHRQPNKRIWKLTDEQAETFKGLHVKVSIERVRQRDGWDAAQSAWLRLLLVAVARWARSEEQDEVIAPKLVDADLLRMWQIIHDYIGEPAGLSDQLKAEIPNYDSLRHRFRKAVGESPTRLWAKLRMQQAQNLLLESNLNIKEIAGRVGYARQHEFTRAFHRRFGMPPTDWRDGTFHTGEKTVHRG